VSKEDGTDFFKEILIYLMLGTNQNRYLLQFVPSLDQISMLVKFTG